MSWTLKPTANPVSFESMARWAVSRIWLSWNWLALSVKSWPKLLASAGRCGLSTIPPSAWPDSLTPLNQPTGAPTGFVAAGVGAGKVSFGGAGAWAEGDGDGTDEPKSCATIT